MNNVIPISLLISLFISKKPRSSRIFISQSVTTTSSPSSYIGEGGKKKTHNLSKGLEFKKGRGGEMLEKGAGWVSYYYKGSFLLVGWSSDKPILFKYLG